MCQSVPDDQTYEKRQNLGRSSAYRFLGFIYLPDGFLAGVTSCLIRKGDTGDAVRCLQERLCTYGYLRKSEIDGDFGRIALGSLFALRLEHGLDVDWVARRRLRRGLWRRNKGFDNRVAGSEYTFRGFILNLGVR